MQCGQNETERNEFLFRRIERKDQKTKQSRIKQSRTCSRRAARSTLVWEISVTAASAAAAAVASCCCVAAFYFTVCSTVVSCLLQDKTYFFSPKHFEIVRPFCLIRLVWKNTAHTLAWVFVEAFFYSFSFENNTPLICCSTYFCHYMYVFNTVFRACLTIIESMSNHWANKIRIEIGIGTVIGVGIANAVCVTRTATVHFWPCVCFEQFGLQYIYRTRACHFKSRWKPIFHSTFFSLPVFIYVRCSISGTPDAVILVAFDCWAFKINAKHWVLSIVSVCCEHWNAFF